MRRNPLPVKANLLGNTLIKCNSEEALSVFNLAKYPCNSVGDQVHDLQPREGGDLLLQPEKPTLANMLASHPFVATLLSTVLPIMLLCSVVHNNCCDFSQEKG